jgi:ubiquinone/menaquinone biosynthesis C-methylase UbiE
MSRGVAYSGLAEQYDLHRHADSEIIRSFIRKATITSSSTILEVGCGTANYIADVVRLTGCELTGCEGFGLD